MGGLFHSLDAALENALTPKCCVSVCLFVVVFCCCFLGQHWGCEDEIGWRTADDALGGSEVLVPEGTGGLCRSYSCTQETGGCRSQTKPQQGGPLSPETVFLRLVPAARVFTLAAAAAGSWV